MKGKMRELVVGVGQIQVTGIFSELLLLEAIDPILVGHFVANTVDSESTTLSSSLSTIDPESRTLRCKVKILFDRCARGQR